MTARGRRAGRRLARKDVGAASVSSKAAPHELSVWTSARRCKCGHSRKMHATEYGPGGDLCRGWVRAKSDWCKCMAYRAEPPK